MGSASVDGRADLYALGCVAFWLLTGRDVFEEDTPMAAIIAHVQRQPTPPSASSELDIPKELDQIVLDCLAKEPAARPANAEALSARLDAVPCASSWTEQNAARWWKTHRPSATPCRYFRCCRRRWRRLISRGNDHSTRIQAQSSRVGSLPRCGTATAPAGCRRGSSRWTTASFLKVDV